MNPESIEKWNIIRGLSDAIGRLQAQAERTIQDNISLAQLKQRRKDLQKLIRPVLVEG